VRDDEQQEGAAGSGDATPAPGDEAASEEGSAADRATADRGERLAAEQAAAGTPAAARPAAGGSWLETVLAVLLLGALATAALVLRHRRGGDPR
jgi:hypothetical protein